MEYQTLILLVLRHVNEWPDPDFPKMWRAVDFGSCFWRESEFAFFLGGWRKGEGTDTAAKPRNPVIQGFSGFFIAVEAI
jgi:hypothetical protein